MKTVWPRRFFVLLSFLLFSVSPPLGLAGNSGPGSSAISFDRIAIMPVFVGKWQPEGEGPDDRTLGCTLAQICEVDPEIKSGAEKTLTRLVQNWFQTRFQDQVVPAARVAEAYLGLRPDPKADTPRALAKELGAAVDADLVLVGTLWRFRDRGEVSGFDESQASVAFALYLVDVKTGRRLWRGLFDESQQAITDNAFQAAKQVGLGKGLRWLSAEELARHGVRQTLKKCPL
jgi:hypothetical protein